MTASYSRDSTLASAALKPHSSPHRLSSSVSSLKPVKLAVVGKVPLGVGLKMLGRVMVRGRTAKKLMKMVPKTNMTTRKMRNEALA